MFLIKEPFFYRLWSKRVQKANVEIRDWLVRKSIVDNFFSIEFDFLGAAGLPGQAGYPGTKGYPGQVGLAGRPGK
jgi:hypothetical protein